MVDTGASISCLPGDGEIMKHARNRIEKTDMTLLMANQDKQKVTGKITAHVRPAGAKMKPTQMKFYILPGRTEMFGYEALIGLPQLIEFNL